jgi:hypothetical protein
MTTTTSHLNYFRVNFDNVLRDVPGGTITAAERRRIARSIQGFQLGEASEGRNLQRLADIHGERTGDPHYLEAIRFLIREENRHSAYLKRFMEEQGIPVVTHCATDGIFRVLRRLMGIETSIRTLVTAEIIALTYYACLAEATGHPGLKAICSRVLDEEREHVKFQMHTVQSIAVGKTRVRRAVADAAHAVLMAGTIVAVWFEHRPVLEASYNFAGFAKTVWSDFAGGLKAGWKSASRALSPKTFSQEATRSMLASASRERARVIA